MLYATISDLNLDGNHGFACFDELDTLEIFHLTCKIKYG
jgi:hypothetical protein